MLFAYNHDIERRDIAPQEMELTLVGQIASIEKAVIDEEHWNPKKAWETMGSPAYLTREQVEVLDKESRLTYEQIPVAGNGETKLHFTAAEESVMIFRISLA